MHSKGESKKISLLMTIGRKKRFTIISGFIRVLKVTERRYKNIGGSKFLKEKAVYIINTTV